MGGPTKIFALAWRNMWRNGRRTLPTLAAMGFGLWVMVLYGLVTGLMQGMEDDVIDYEVGEIQVFADGYRDDPTIYTRIDDADALIAALDPDSLRQALTCARKRAKSLVVVAHI